MIRSRLSSAYLAAIAGIGFFSIMDMVMKGLTLSAGVFATMFYRSLAGILLGGLLFLAFPSRWPDRPTLRLHVVRGVVTTAMALLFFWGLARVPMAQAVALSFIAPLIALLLAALVLGESLGSRVVTGSLLAAFGVGVIFVGQARADIGPQALLGSIAILASALIYAWNIILMRQQAQAARPVEIAFFQNLVVGLSLLVASVFVGVPTMPTTRLAEVGLAGTLAVASNLLLAWAYARGGAAYLSTTEYSSFLWALALGWLRFGEKVSDFTLAGAALIVAGCWIAARRSPHPALEATA